MRLPDLPPVCPRIPEVKRPRRAPGALLLLLLCLACGRDSVIPPQELTVQSVLGREARARELAATSDKMGMLWLVFLELPIDPSEKNAELKLMLANSNDPGKPLALTTIASGPDLGPVTLAPLEDGGVFIVWEANGLLGRSAVAEKSKSTNKAILFGPVIVIPTAKNKPLLPHAASLIGGGIGLTWQALEAQSMRVYFAHRNHRGNWSLPQLVSQNDANGTSDAWRPRVTSAPDGHIQVVYDFFKHGGTSGFDIWLASSTAPGRPFTQKLIAGGPTYQGLPDLGVDQSGRTWISYEESPSFGQTGSLRNRRQTRLVAVAKDGRLHHAILPRQLSTEQRGDFPKLLVSPFGLALTRRLPKDDFQPRNNDRRAFFTTWLTSVLGFNARGEGYDLELASTDGDNENDAVLLFGQNGFHLYFASDDRSTTFGKRYSFEVAIENPWRLSHASLPLAVGFPLLRPGPPPPFLQAWAEPIPQGLAHPDRDPHALFGDLHRHTDLSRCSGRQDGTFLDAVRYARGPGALDFLAITDHFQHLTTGSYWRELRDAERWNALGSLIVLPGIERVIRNRGHQNLIFDSSKSAREAGSRIAPIHLPTETFVAIPHMSALPRNHFDWSTIDTDVQRLVEVHQGKRGSYEGLPITETSSNRSLAGQATWPMAALEANDASGWITHLAAQLGPDQIPPGLISSSDHSSSNAGFAGITLAPGQPRELSRTAVFSALHQRRTFATTGPAPGHKKRHRLAVEAAGGQLSIHADRMGLVALTILENGREISVPDSAAKASSSLVTERQLVVRTYFGSRGPRTFSLSANHIAIESRGFSNPFPKLSTIASNNNEVQLSISPRETEGLNFVVALSPTEASAQRLHFKLSGKKETSLRSLSLDIDITTLLASPTRRFWLEAIGKSPYFDLDLLPEPLPPGTGPIEFSLDDRSKGSIYYVRATWEDGHIAWSRMLRMKD